MRAIEVLEEQQNKLIEMCKILFPEYLDIDYGLIIGEDTGGFIYNNDISLLDSKRGWINIPWFEFCVTNLYNEFKRRAIDIDLYFFTLNPEHCQWPKEYNHPIDYLYFKFKEINL